MAITVAQGEDDMKTTTETFLEQSRAYLFATEVRLQHDVLADRSVRADWPWPAPRPGNRRPARSSKDRRRVRTAQLG